jgi:pyridoxine 4-dehydrogenase
MEFEFKANDLGRKPSMAVCSIHRPGEKLVVRRERERTGAVSDVTPASISRRRLGPYSVAPIGFGAMRLTGRNMFGPPADRAEALAVLREAVELGVDHIDTSEYYGPTVVNEMIREALSPYPENLVLVSKVGAARGPGGEVIVAEQPVELRLGIEDNLRTLGVDMIHVVNLRLHGSGHQDADFDDKLQAMVAARDDGLIGAVGLSNVSVDTVLYAAQSVEIACVQNAFNPLDRQSTDVLGACLSRDIAFVPFAPLGFGASEVLKNPTVAQVAVHLGCTPAQACLAWELALASNLLLIPGTSSREHLRENLAAAHVSLDPEALSLLNGLA